MATFADRGTIRASELAPAGDPTLERLPADPSAVRRSSQLAGWRATVPLVAKDGRLRFLWRAIVRDQSNYIRQEVTVASEAGEAAVLESCG